MMMTCTNLSDAVELQTEESLLPAIRSALESLPILDRQLIALHFGGGLSPIEIGNALALPHAAIRQLLRTAVASMHASLVDQGIADPISDDTVRRAVTSGLPAPIGLYEKVQQRISNALHTTGTMRHEISLTARFAILLTVYITCTHQH
jgi:hypothetical protein